MAHNTPQQPHCQTHPLSRGDWYAWVIMLLFTFLSSCKPDNVQDGSKPMYFDIAGYFKAETAKLHKLNQLTLKTVVHNGVKETKKVHIDDWGLELSLFIRSDINKPAWRDSYSVQTGKGDSVVYLAKTPELRTREVVITRNKGNNIKCIMIYNVSKNILYQTNEVLGYIPDSLYTIKKTQHVRFLGTNNYFIKGTLN